MNCLVYSVAIGKASNSVLDALDSKRLKITEENTGYKINRLENRPLRASPNIRWEIESYDLVIQLESDVSSSLNFDEISKDEITVEKGHCSFSDLKTKDGKILPDIPYTGLGVVTIPKSCFLFWNFWKKEYETSWLVHQVDEYVLFLALEKSGLPWKYRNDNSFWPEKNKVTHYQGINAKRSLVPDYTIQLAQSY